MAQRDVSKEDILELVTCSLCTEEFREPRALPCLHTFCLSCLEQLVVSNPQARTVKCPLCQADWVIPSGIQVQVLLPSYSSVNPGPQRKSIDNQSSGIQIARLSHNPPRKSPSKTCTVKTFPFQGASRVFRTIFGLTTFWNCAPGKNTLLQTPFHLARAHHPPCKK